MLLQKVVKTKHLDTRQVLEEPMPDVDNSTDWLLNSRDPQAAS